LPSLYASSFRLIFLSRGKPNVPIILTVHKKTPPVGAIVGGVIGGVAFFLIVAGAVFFWRRSRVQQPKIVIDPHYEEEQAKPRPFNTQYAPYKWRYCTSIAETKF
jgi:hypothetical protein